MPIFYAICPGAGADLHPAHGAKLADCTITTVTAAGIRPGKEVTMTNNNTPNTTQQASTQPEGNGPAGKMFTQEEVNSIVKDRLARERAKGQTSGTTDNSAAELDTEKAQLEADRQKLQDERNAFECERYCKENGIDTQLVELIGGSDPEEFKEKTESLWSIFAKSQKNQPGTVAVVSTGAPHGSMSQLKEPDGAQFFKPSGTY